MIFVSTEGQVLEGPRSTVVIAVDLSASLSFGSAERLKRESATEVGAALAFAAAFLAWRGLLHLVPFLLALV